MTITVVYDNSEVTELCAAQHLYLKPIAKLMINVLLPECTEPMRPFSNWEVLDKLKSLICPDQFTTVRLSKSTKDFILFEGEAETQRLIQIFKTRLHGKFIKLNGLKTDLKVVATDAQGEWEHFPKDRGEQDWSDEEEEEQDLEKSPDSIYFEGLPCKWFAPKGSSGEKPCEEILRVVFESFGKIKNVDIPMLDPYREVMTDGSCGGFNMGLQTFEAFIQYQESTDFVRAMDSLQGMKLLLKGDDGKALACNIKVMFDTSKHFSEGAIRRRNQERLKLQELEEERKKEKKRQEQEAERKRKEEERRAQEKRRKARAKRRALKEKDRHRQRKQKDRAKVEEAIKEVAEEPTEEVAEEPTEEPYSSSPEWEERKYLLAQRRVEALRLLRVLLRDISVKLFSGPRTLRESTELDPEEGNGADPKANGVLGNTPGNPKKADLNTQHLHNQDDVPTRHIAKPDNKQRQKMKRRTHFQESSHHPEKKRTRHLSRKARTREMLPRACVLVSDQNSLQVTMIQDQSLETEDYRSSNGLCLSRFSAWHHSQKQKVYETDEFIDYLLNYYQAPEYSRVCLQPSDLMHECHWQRAVHATEDGLQISLRKLWCHSSNLSPMQFPGGIASPQEENHWTKICAQQTAPKSGKMDYIRECMKQLQNPRSVHEPDCHLSLDEEESYLMEETQIHQVKTSRTSGKSLAFSPARSVDVYLNLSDFLEEISSDSECFSEILSMDKEEKEKSMTTCSSSPERGFINTDEVGTFKQVPSSQQTQYSRWPHEAEEKCLKFELSNPGSRVKCATQRTWLECEPGSPRDENTNKKRALLVTAHLSDAYSHQEDNPEDPLDNVCKKRKKCNDKTFGQRVSDRASHVPGTPSKMANARHLRDVSQRGDTPWESEYNQDTRRFKQHENVKACMPKSGDSSVEENGEEYLDSGSYVGSNHTSSLYFQMF
ncbi:A-kinase anchor protein 17B-like [Erinaceus europaeus]|uniref:A-kinase anchor protein 17B-like n=1 Tax=Erinaceus europaeus TaxID=9365 RepID=A0ABM3WSC6_ERIEU|nr:A-kinase anchor protein 17B-like [Erinaceus europaeus]XP_060039451.1 A-kinase anchor protein 17B-like [Erinaceus europaeus]